MTTLKKILSLILVICMLACVFSLTACGGKNKGNEGENNNETEGNNGGNSGNEATTKTFTVTVLDGDNNPVEGVKLILTDNKTYPSVTTGNDGKASAEFADGSTVSVMVATVPSGYVKPTATSGVYHGAFAKNSTELTLRVEKERDNKVEYTVKVVDQNGDAVVGISVQLCYNGICAPAVATNADGEITTKLAADTVVDVKLYAIDGYTLPAANANGYHATSGETEIIIEITKN